MQGDQEFLSSKLGGTLYFGAGSGLLGFLAHLVGSNRGVARAAFVWRVMASFVGILLFELGVETVIDLEHWRVGRLVAFGAVSAAVAVVLYLTWQEPMESARKVAPRNPRGYPVPPTDHQSTYQRFRHSKEPESI